MTRKPRILRTTFIAGLVALMPGGVMADVTVHRQTSLDGMGGMLKMSMTTTESYSGDMMASDDETKMENKLMKMFGGGKPFKESKITRLDKELMWNVNHNDKHYSEMPFAEMRAMMDSLGSMMESASPDPMAQQKPTIDTSEITFSEPTFEVKQTGKKETIAGYDCDQAILTMTTEGTNRETGEKMTLDLTVDLMLAQNVAGVEEVKAFGLRMAEALGYGGTDYSGNSAATRMLEKFGIDPEKLAEETKKLEGYAMKSTMTFSIGGDAVDSAQAAMERAEAEQAEETEKEEGEEAEESEESPADASAMAAKALGGLFGGKKDKKDDEGEEAREGEDDAPQAPPGAMFWMTSTVTGIETGSVSPSKFEPPAGYELIGSDDE